MGTGFPSGFTIQTSTDNVIWTTVSTQTSYPEVQPGHAELINFVPVSARYVRVTGTQMRATTGETNSYRMAFAEMEVFAG
jgi:hypothetical protein